MIDAVPGIAGGGAEAVQKSKPQVATWSVPLESLYANGDIRLDASHYDQHTSAAIDELRSCGRPLHELSQLADVRLPGQFVRIWAKDKAHGLPYVNATDLMGLTGIGLLNDSERYLSRQSKVHFDELTIREGWLLVTCSGTIGRVFYVPKRLDGWIATHDLIRIVPHDKAKTGFLHAYLSSPFAQRQIAGHTHGGQIDHVTHHQLRNILVPEVDAVTMQAIHEHTMAALDLREQAILKLTEIDAEMGRAINP